MATEILVVAVRDFVLLEGKQKMLTPSHRAARPAYTGGPETGSVSAPKNLTSASQPLRK
jgi:hypothetical protein